MKSIIAFLETVPSICCALSLALLGCDTATTVSAEVTEPGLKPGNAGGKKGGGETSLVSDLISNSNITNDGSAYVAGDIGVTAHLTRDGAFSLITSSPRTVTIGAITALNGDTLLSAPGSVEARFQTYSCCDLRAMTADSADTTLDGNPLHIKLLVEWAVSDGAYKLSYGSSKCVDSSPPSNDPRRGRWALVTQTVSASDTTWTIEGDGPAAFCRLFDNPGHKNDSLVVLSTEAATIVRLTATSQ